MLCVVMKSCSFNSLDFGWVRSPTADETRNETVAVNRFELGLAMLRWTPAEAIGEVRVWELSAINRVSKKRCNFFFLV